MSMEIFFSDTKPKFNKGEAVVNKVERKVRATWNMNSADRDITCAPFSKVTISDIEKKGESFLYRVTMTGCIHDFEFMEDELTAYTKNIFSSQRDL